VTPNFPRISSLSSRTYYPLHTAVKQNNVRVVKTLLDLGADPFCKNSAGQSPADWARQRNWRGSYSDVLALFDGLLREAKEESELLEAKDEGRSASEVSVSRGRTGASVRSGIAL